MQETINIQQKKERGGAIAKKHKNNILHRFYTNKIVDFTYILYHRTESEKEEVSICLE